MSLSFVSSSVLSSTDGVSHNEETEVSSKELDAVRRNAGSSSSSSSSKPLFEQLRSNQMEQEESKAEAERARMRGTLALDEDDVAHLNALSRCKAEMEFKRRVELDQEMALFRAAKEDRRTGHVVIDNNDDDNNNNNNGVDDDKDEATKSRPKIANQGLRKAAIPTLLPKIVGKRRRKGLGSDIALDTKKQKQKPETRGNLEHLLGAYGSSSSSDDDKD